MARFKVLKGISYPKSKTIRDQIRAEEKTSADVTEWVRVKAGKTASIPADLVPEFKRREAIEEA